MYSMSSGPLVSCLCVTHQRVELLKRSVSCFLGQSYENRELLIVYEDHDLETAYFIEKITHPKIVPIMVKTSSKLSLGALRNLSIDRCNGSYFCQWDDDDWFKENRIAYQIKTLKKTNYNCSILSNWLIYDCRNKKAYLSGFRPWEGSILCKKSLIQNEMGYLGAKKGEDTYLVKKLVEKGHVISTFYPTLYIYVYHGANVWDAAHWAHIISYGKELSAESSKMVENIFEKKYSYKEASKLLDQHFQLFDHDV